MSSSPIDYNALAAKTGAVASTPPAAGAVDYNALAKQTGAIASQPPAAQAPDTFGSLWEGAKQYASGVAKQLNPATIVSGLANAAAHPIDTAKGIVNAQSNVLDEATDSFKKGDYKEAIKHGALYLLPVAGPQIDELSNKAEHGQLAEALGEATGAGLLMAGPESPIVKAGAAKVVSKAGDVARDAVGAIKLPVSGTPEQRAAADWAMQNGAPLDAAAATLNPNIRKVQEVSKSFIGAGRNAQRAIDARNDWYAAKGQELADAAHPTAQTPESAGRAISSAGVKTIQDANAEAATNYNALKARESDPANVRSVVTGTKDVPSGRLDSNGKPVMQSEAIEEDVPLPVDMKPFRAQFQPALDDVRRLTRLGQSQYAPAQIALEDIVNGPDYVPASVAEKNLGALKGVSRNNTLTGGVRNEAGALAAAAVPKLQSAIDDTVSSIAGKDALNNLQAGRLATADKYEAIDLVDQFRAEPVKLYQQLTSKQDGAIDLLNQVKTLAPDQMPKLGRAYLDAALDHATESGGFAHADKLFADWQKLGPGTKDALFNNPEHPGLLSDLDNFFQSAKDSAQIENKSGTASVAHMSAQGTLVVGSPFLGTSYILGGNVLSRLLYNPKFVRAAIKGFGVDAADKGASALAAAKIASAAKSAGVTPTPATPGASAPVPVTATSGPAATAAGNGAAADSASQLSNVGRSANAGTASESGAVSGANGTNAASQARNGADTFIRVPGQTNGYKARYQVQELGDIQPSHNGLNFQANPKYALSNDRTYRDATNQAKVVEWSTRSGFDPSFHITDNPDATNGPMVVDSSGNVLGGNGRAMILQRVNKGNATGAAAYRDLLIQKAQQFGVDPETVKGMKQPVLTRVVPDSEFGPNAAKANAISEFNIKPTAELTPAERSIADARRVSPDTLQDIAGRLDDAGDKATLSDVLEGKSGTDILKQLVNDGVIAPQERAAFANENGLTKAGRDRISSLVVGRYFRDPAQLDSIAPSVKTKLERMAAPLAKVESKGDWSLTGHVQDAIDLLEAARAHGHAGNLEDFIAQDGLFGKQKYSAEAVTLAKALQGGMTQRQLTAAARQYAEEAAFASKGESMFGAPPTAAEAFEAAFAGKSADSLGSIGK